MRNPQGRERSATNALQSAGLLLAAALVLFLATGCALNYAEGQQRERQKRWEEALISYHLALIEDPQDTDYQEAVARARKVVARENFDRYKDFLAKKAFRKAYRRLVDAARQDPEFAPVREEMAKWTRVLIGGQVVLDLAVSQPSITLADQITLTARINSPNPGETLDANIDLDTGLFFVEDLLYDRSDELLTLYSLNAIGVNLVFGRSRIKNFTSREFVRFVNIRTPVLGELRGKMFVAQGGPLLEVKAHRDRLTPAPWVGKRVQVASNPDYSMSIQGNTIRVAAKEGDPVFTPRHLYLNKQDRRVFVDFGGYELQLQSNRRHWNVSRLPLDKEDYFENMLRNIALQPYFFYREGVYDFVPAPQG